MYQQDTIRAVIQYGFDPLFSGAQIGSTLNHSLFQVSSVARQCVVLLHLMNSDSKLTGNFSRDFLMFNSEKAGCIRKQSEYTDWTFPIHEQRTQGTQESLV